MVLAELKQLASSLGIKGIGAMRKSQLIDAIRAAQRGTGTATFSDGTEQDDGFRSQGSLRSQQDRAESGNVPRALEELPQAPREAAGQREEAHMLEQPVQPDLMSASSTPDSTSADSTTDERRQPVEAADGGQVRQEGGKAQDGADRIREDTTTPREAGDGQRESDRSDEQARADEQASKSRADEAERGDGSREGRQTDRRDRRTRDQQARENQQRDNQGRENQGRDWEEEGGGRRGRRRRSRDRQNRRNRGGGGNLDRYDTEPVVSEDDVLVPARGILDVLDNYAFVRTNGYLPGPDDAYVSLSLVKKLGLRKGDLVTGMIRTPREGERKEKFNPMVRIDTVNGGDLESARQRSDFAKLTPLYPQERLKLETTPTQMAGRIIDLVAPIGKGQRALIVSPSKAGKTLIMQAIANSVAINNPEVKLMVVLVDERPEEVTDFQRSAKGEVISSTFDRPAEDHTTVAELAIERAKRLVELGHDVVILLDGITRLSRAYNLAAPASGRILSGGVDSAALYPPKKFLGAARNIEGGGSLTIIATALVETGSKMDEVIFEEFKGTGNSEIRLRREFAEKRIFPAIDVDASSTRREELLMSREELAIVWKLRRVLSGLESLQGLEMLLDRLRKTQSNAEFLMAITKTIPAQD
ncbi:MAG TPA: transcription termination factor Rho [Propionibacteriaceae bacterium]|nr:transcription termination factor Rho [Propionibacteriaceae bacterium]